MAFSFKRSITIDHTQVPNTDQTDFPVLFAGTYAWLATVANGGDVTSSSGYDIVFTSDSAGLNLLEWEPEKYISTTGEVVFWVKTPSLSHTADTVIYIWYGNAAITTPQYVAADVWDNDFAFVLHMTLVGGTGSNIINSSTNSGTTDFFHFDSGTAATAAAEKIGDGLNFTSAAAYVEGTPGSRAAIPTGAAERTLECWFKIATGYTADASLIGYGGNVNYNGQRYQIYYLSNVMYLEGRGISSGIPFTPDSAWHHFAAVFPPGATNINQALLYLDGALTTPTTGTSGTINTLAGDFIVIGGLSGAQNVLSFIGQLDETRLSQVARSADWIAASYNNQNNPAGFYAIGTAVSGTVTIHADIDGNVSINGTITPHVVVHGSIRGSLSINGTASSHLHISASVVGNIAINGAAAPHLFVHATSIDGNIDINGMAIVKLNIVPPSCISGDGIVTDPLSARHGNFAY